MYIYDHSMTMIGLLIFLAPCLCVLLCTLFLGTINLCPILPIKKKKKKKKRLDVNLL